MIGISKHNKYEYQVVEVGLASRDLACQWGCTDTRIQLYRVELQAKGTSTFPPFLSRVLTIGTTTQPQIGESYFMRFEKENEE